MPSRSDTIAPFVRAGIAPCHGAQPSKSVFMVAVPRVSVRKWERKPIRPRDGTRNSIRTRPPPVWSIFAMIPRRTPSSCVTTPTYSSGESTTRSSTGSSTTPSRPRTMTVGLETCSSKPSRRIVSMSTASWSSPRPTTRNVSMASVSSTRMLTFRSISWKSRSRTWRDVTLLPDRPAHGLVLAPNSMVMVGSSTRMGFSAVGASLSATVSPMLISSMPAIATMSPESARSISTRFKPCQP